MEMLQPTGAEAGNVESNTKRQVLDLKEELLQPVINLEVVGEDEERLRAMMK